MARLTVQRDIVARDACARAPTPSAYAAPPALRYQDRADLLSLLRDINPGARWIEAGGARYCRWCCEREGREPSSCPAALLEVLR